MNEKNKTASRNATRGSRKQNTAAGRQRKPGTSGTGSRSQTNKTKVAGVKKANAKKTPRTTLRQKT